MPFRLGLPEILILLVIVLILFGPGRIGKIAGELGQGIRNFRDGLSKKDETQEPPKTDDK
jgi:sec-independent protein translocase protein TatA